MIWAKATLEKFGEYGITIDTQRQLNDGEYIIHMELTHNPEFFLATRFDEEVKLYTEEQMEEILLLDPTGEV